MTAIGWKWVWMTGLIAAAIASYGILVGSPEGPAVSSERPVQPGYYLKNAILTITQADGSERLKLVAERIDEQVGDSSFTAAGVTMNYVAATGRPWTLRADAAEVPADLETVAFSGNVEVRGGANAATGIIRTQTLDFDMNANIARTAAPVAIEFAGHRLNATGLEADLESERLQLESGVNGRFE